MTAAHNMLNETQMRKKYAQCFTTSYTLPTLPSTSLCALQACHRAGSEWPQSVQIMHRAFYSSSSHNTNVIQQACQISPLNEWSADHCICPATITRSTCGNVQRCLSYSSGTSLAGSNNSASQSKLSCHLYISLHSRWPS